MNDFALKNPSSDFRAVRDGRTSTLFYYDVDLTAGRSVIAGNALILPLTGNVFYADTAPQIGNTTVHFQDTNLSSQGAPVYISPGFIAKVPFTKLLIENTAQPGKILRFFYGVDVDFISGNNIAISGNVNIVDNSQIRTLAGYGFLANVSQSPLAANNAHTQLYNPPGSGKNLVIESFSLSSDLAGQIYSGHYNVPLTNQLPAGPQFNKYSNGGGSVALRCNQNNVGILLMPHMTSLVVANQQIVVNFRAPVIIAPGDGYCSVAGTLGASMNTTFEFYETPV